MSDLRRRSIFLLVLTALLWSSSGLFIKVIRWEPFSILGARSMISTVVFWIYLRHFTFHWTRMQVIGALGYVGAQLFFIIGTKLTTAANAIFLQYTSPLYILLFGYWLLGERPRRADWASMLVIFAGMLLFFCNDLSLDGLHGNVFGVLSGVSMAVMIVCMRSQKAGVPANMILLGNIFGIIVGLPSLLHETFSLLSLSIILYLGIFQIGLSFVFYSIAIKHIQALESTLILTMEPVLNPLWVFLVLGEVPGMLAFIGGALVLGAVTARAIIGARIEENVIPPERYERERSVSP
jgi:drug/metabolite transporter (DMT)-like permease